MPRTRLRTPLTAIRSAVEVALRRIQQPETTAKRSAPCWRASVGSPTSLTAAAPGPRGRGHADRQAGGV
jgi:hypothetical protein